MMGERERLLLGPQYLHWSISYSGHGTTTTTTTWIRRSLRDYGIFGSTHQRIWRTTGRNHKLMHVAGWVTLNLFPASISSLYLKLSAELVEKAPVLHLSTAGQRTILENYLRFKCKENQEVETLKNVNPKPESCLRDTKLSTFSQTFYSGKLLSFKGNRS